MLGQSEIGYTSSFFVQDDWRVTRAPTLNLGLRYDFQQEPLERNNGVSNFDPYTKDPVTGLLGRTVYAGLDGQPRSFRPDVHADFAPRFGFAFDPFGDGKLVVRGGYAIFYPRYSRSSITAARRAFRLPLPPTFPPATMPTCPPSSSRRACLLRPIEPQGSKLGSNPFLGQGVSYEESDGAKAHVPAVEFSIQKKLGSSWMIDATYSGNRGQHFAAGSYDINQLDPKYLSLGQDLNSQVPNPNAGKIPARSVEPRFEEPGLAPYPQYTAVNVASPRLGSFTSNLFIAERRETHVARIERAGSPIRAGRSSATVSRRPLTLARLSRRMKSAFRMASSTGGSIARSIPTMFPRGAWSASCTNFPSDVASISKVRSAVVKTIIGGWQVNTIGAMQTGLPLIIRGAPATFCRIAPTHRQERQAG